MTSSTKTKDMEQETQNRAPHPINIHITQNDHQTHSPWWESSFAFLAAYFAFMLLGVLLTLLLAD